MSSPPVWPYGPASGGALAGRTALVTLLALAGLALGSPPVAGGASAVASSLVGSGPVPRIVWRPCVDQVPSGFDCAAVRVPLDYRHPRGDTIRLALTRLWASDQANRIGTLFWDPGGPGGSGTKFLPGLADKIFSAELRARFDIVGLDPRGVGASTAIQCFATAEDETRFFAGAPRRLGAGFPVGRAQMATWIERYRRFGHLCARRNPRLLRHVSTVDAARDLDLLRRAVGDRGLNYIGTSYGTFLGATYANMFPRRVRAIVLDGNVNPVPWVSLGKAATGGLHLSTGLRLRADEGAAKSLRAFLDLCGQAGAERCAFAAGTPAATRVKFAALLQHAPKSPTGVRKSYAELVSETMVGLYSLSAWGATASSLQSEWIKVTSGSTGRAAAPRLSAGGQTMGATSRYAGEEQELAVACGETPNPPAVSFPRVDAFAFRRSGVVGPYWAWDYEPCSTWPVRSANRYTGPWNRRTANPVLVIGNTFDPATNYRSAVAMARLLARARLLTLDGYGHTALLNPSACVIAYQDEYFISGTLPPPGTRCSQDDEPFQQ